MMKLATADRILGNLRQLLARFMKSFYFDADLGGLLNLRAFRFNCSIGVRQDHSVAACSAAIAQQKATLLAESQKKSVHYLGGN